MFICTPTCSFWPLGPLQQRDCYTVSTKMTTDALAIYTPFYLLWKPLMALPQHTERPRWYRRTSLCSPPVTKEAFQQQSSQPFIYRWTPGSLDQASAEDLPYLEEYKTSSVVWRPDHQTYLTVPYDCTQNSVTDMERHDPLDHWERLKFNHEVIDGRCVSVVGHRNGNDVLAATGPHNWLGELVPPAHQRHDEPDLPNTVGPSYLAGDISIIMALAALSTTPNLVRWTIANSFRPRNELTWVPHGQGGGAGSRRNPSWKRSF